MTSGTTHDNPPAPSPASSLIRSYAPAAAAVIIALIVHFLIVPRIEPLYAKVMMDIGINIMLAVSLNLVNGMTGQFSIGHAGFMAVGGYVAAAVTYYGSMRLWGSPAFAGGIISSTNPLEFTGPIIGGGDLLFIVSCMTGGAAAALAGLLVGMPSLRLRGDYLAIVTLGFGEIVRVLIERTGPQIATAQELSKVAFPLELLSLGGALGFGRVPFYTTPFWVTLFVATTLIWAYRLRQSTYGRAFFSIRENAIAAEAMGVPVTRYKVSAFVLAAFFAGGAGGLFAHQIGATLNPGELGFQKSFDILIMVVLGGLGSISGSTLAAIVITLLPEILRAPPHVWHFGLAIVALILIIRRKQGVRPAMIFGAIVAALEIIRDVAVDQGVDLSKYRMILYALSLILIMMLRPRGLLGTRELWEIIPFLSRLRRSERAE